MGAGASPDLATTDTGTTPLYIACETNYADVVELLLSAGASADCANGTGVLPLHSASAGGHVVVVKQLLAAGASTNPSSSIPSPLVLATQRNQTAVVQLLEVWPVLTRLMVATVMRQCATVRELLHSGEDPTVTVAHQQRTLNAMDLAKNEPACNWAAPVCTKIVALIKKSLKWSPYDPQAHQLFPPCFRRGVRHCLGLMVALNRVHRGLPQHMWMLVIAHLPRDWGFENA